MAAPQGPFPPLALAWWRRRDGISRVVVVERTRPARGRQWRNSRSLCSYLVSFSFICSVCVVVGLFTVNGLLLAAQAREVVQSPRLGNKVKLQRWRLGGGLHESEKLKKARGARLLLEILLRFPAFLVADGVPALSASKHSRQVINPFSARACRISRRNALTSSPACRRELFIRRLVRITLHRYARAMPSRDSTWASPLSACLRVSCVI